MNPIRIGNVCVSNGGVDHLSIRKRNRLRTFSPSCPVPLTSPPTTTTTSSSSSSSESILNSCSSLYRMFALELIHFNDCCSTNNDHHNSNRKEIESADIVQDGNPIDTSANRMGRAYTSAHYPSKTLTPFTSESLDSSGTLLFSSVVRSPLQSTLSVTSSVSSSNRAVNDAMFSKNDGDQYGNHQRQPQQQQHTTYS
ncbi:hypothetical protein RDWZM_009172, partial [Blomia tropicalis]